jgi:hypothetical protein
VVATGPQRVEQIGDGDTSSPAVAAAVLVRDIVSVVLGVGKELALLNPAPVSSAKILPSWHS